MKKYIFILLLFLFVEMNAQMSEKLFVIFNTDETCSLEKIKIDRTQTKYVLKSKSDSLVMQKTNVKSRHIRKIEVENNRNKINACDLITQGIKKYIELIENKKIYLLVKCKSKFEIIEVEGLIFYEKAQD